MEINEENNHDDHDDQNAHIDQHSIPSDASS
jgi:hypothetical protein